MGKQSSIEWLWHNLTDNLIGDLPNEKIHEIYNLVLQAKQMHKEEIEDAWDNGAYGSEGFMPNIETSQEYYNERFKGSNNKQPITNSEIPNISKIRCTKAYGGNNE